MKKIISILLTLLLIISVIPTGLFTITASAAVTSGTTRDCTWTLDGTVLTISGNGDMGSYYDWNDKVAPWGTAITSVVIENGVTSIAYSAFSGCSSLTSITIPDSVTSIGGGAFGNCTSLTSITIPNSVTSIDGSAFSGCSSLISIDVESGNNYYSLQDGVLFNKTKTEIICYPAGKTLTAYTIPSSVTSIGGYAFSDCSSLTSITIGDSVTSIGSYAFSDCSSLTSITIPNSVTSIGSGVFYYCTSLESVTIPNSVKMIGWYAFSGCSSLTSITIGDSVTSIGDYAFENCTSLKTVNFNAEQCTEMGSSPNVFSNCTSLTTINIGSKVKTIPSDAFYNCDGLTSITIPNSVISIGSHAFSGCNGIKSITIGDSVTSIGAGAFRDCTSLTSITIPNSVKTIGFDAFHKCNSLETITLPFIGENADGTGSTNFGYIFGARADDFTYYYNKVQYVPTSLKEVVVTGSNAIAEKAFYDCTSLTSVAILGNVNLIGERAFYYCTSLKNIRLPKTCKTIKWEAFRGCYNLTNVFYGGTATQKDSIDIDWTNDELEEHAKWYYNSCVNSTKHTYKITTTKATLTKNGSIFKKCSVCNVASTTAIKYPKSFALTTTNYTYTGAVRTPGVIVKDSAGKVLKNKTDYTVSYAGGRTNVGTYKVTVTMKGNYSGTKTLYFKINPASYSKCKFALTTTNYTYNGALRTPGVIIKYGNLTLKKNVDYTVAYSSGRKNIGTYKVTVKMKGKYSGTKTLTFKINPPKTTVSKLTAGKKSIIVAISKKSSQVTGYQVQYSTSKSFSKATTKTISSYKTTKYTLKSLSAKKTYYVRVRTYKTVGKTKYYSGWSTYKYVKTK